MAASVFENVNEGLMITDAEGKIVQVNKAFVSYPDIRRMK
ncbi:PAS domain-containing protein [Aliamphritea spongicola]